MALPAALAISGLNDDEPQDVETFLNDLFTRVLLKNTKEPGYGLSSTSSNSSTETLCSQESGVGGSLTSSLMSSPRTAPSTPKEIGKFFEFMYQNPLHLMGAENANDSALNLDDEFEENGYFRPNANNVKTILFEGRDILDLGSNLSQWGNTWGLQYAVMKQGVQFFFDNRSQFSRLGDDFPPIDILITCHDEECGLVCFDE